MQIISGRSSSLISILILFMSGVVMQIQGAKAPKYDTVSCFNKGPCFLKKMACPSECPYTSPTDPAAKICTVNCKSPVCKAECRKRKPNCNGPGSACLDPRFIGGDGIVFYFHGKKDEHFNLVSDTNLHINARFIGLRPEGRARDYTWIQALGILFYGENTFTVEATRASSWDDGVDHLRFSCNGQPIAVPEGQASRWTHEQTELKVERTSRRNSATVTIPGVAEISVNVVPITKEDDRVHKYHIPSDDCFAHLEVQFRFFGLSSKVDGVLGRTYRLDFQNPAKPGVAMPVLGGENFYRTTSLLSYDCGTACVFSPSYQGEAVDSEELVVEHSMLDCTGHTSGGNGIVCRK